MKKLSEQEKIDRKNQRIADRMQAKELARIESEKNQKPVKELTITIEWKKSRMWGSNPHAEAQVTFHNGTYQRKEGYSASGCGYDKESTVIAEIFNDFLRYKLWNMTPEQIKGRHGSGDSGPAPYGINHYEPVDPDKYGPSRSYAGGIGTSCYYAISEYIGGKFERVAGGKTFDVYKYTDN